MKKIAILGSGITSLALARLLEVKGHDCTIYEATQRIGGSIETVSRDGFICENGPNSLMVSTVEIQQFIESIPYLSTKIVHASPSAKKRYLAKDGALYPLPMSPVALCNSKLLPMSAKLGLFRDLIRMRRPELSMSTTVAEFARRYFGAEIYAQFVNPAVGGVFAGDPESLLLSSSFPKFFERASESSSFLRACLRSQRKAKQDAAWKKPEIISFEGGLQTLTRSIADALRKPIRLNTRILELKDEQLGGWTVVTEDDTVTYDDLISTCPAHQVKHLPFSEPIRKALSFLEEIDHPPVRVTHLGYRELQIKKRLEGFGALIPEREQLSMLGILFPSSVFPERAPDGHQLFTIFTGGSRQPEMATSSLDATMPQIQKDLGTLLGIQGPPVFKQSRLWSHAIPQYTKRHNEILTMLEKFEARLSNLRLLGTYRSGISLPSRIVVAQETAARF